MLRGQVNHGGHVPYNTYSADHDRGFSLGTMQHDTDRHSQYNGPSDGSTTVLQRPTNLPPQHQHRNVRHAGRHFVRVQHLLIA